MEHFFGSLPVNCFCCRSWTSEKWRKASPIRRSRTFPIPYNLELQLGMTHIIWIIWVEQGIHVVGKGSWKKTWSSKVRNEIRKNEVSKFEPKLENFRLLNTALETFQLGLVLSNFYGNSLTSNFPTARIFQLPFLTISPAKLISRFEVLSVI